MADYGAIGVKSSYVKAHLLNWPKEKATAFFISITAQTDKGPIGSKYYFSIQPFISLSQDFKAVSVKSNIAKKIATWAITDTTLIDTTGYISGIFIHNNDPVPNAIVRLYYEPNGLLIESQRTLADGSFRFNSLEVGNALYTILGYKDGYNVVSIADLVPVHE